MIRVDFFTAKDGGLNGFQIKGHSGSAASGEDIVCAAVSSAAYLTANTITEILHADASVFVDDGEMALRLPKKSVSQCGDLLAGLKLHLLSLEEQYPENIHVNYTEVVTMLKINIQLFAHKKEWAPPRTAVIPNPSALA